MSSVGPSGHTPTRPPQLNTSSPSPRSVVATVPLPLSPTRQEQQQQQQLPPTSSSLPSSYQTSHASSSPQLLRPPVSDSTRRALFCSGGAQTPPATTVTVSPPPLRSLPARPTAPSSPSITVVAGGRTVPEAAPVHGAPAFAQTLRSPPSRLLSPSPPAPMSGSARPRPGTSETARVVSGRHRLSVPSTAAPAPIPRLIHDLYRSVLTERPSQPLPFIVSRLHSAGPANTHQLMNFDTPTTTSVATERPTSCTQSPASLSACASLSTSSTSPPLRTQVAASAPPAMTSPTRPAQSPVVVVVEVHAPGAMTDLGELSPPVSVSEESIVSGEGRPAGTSSSPVRLSHSLVSAHATPAPPGGETLEQGEGGRHTSPATVACLVKPMESDRPDDLTKVHDSGSSSGSRPAPLPLALLGPEPAVQPHPPSPRPPRGGSRQEVEEIVASPPASRFTCPTAAPSPSLTHAAHAPLSHALDTTTPHSPMHLPAATVGSTMLDAPEGEAVYKPLLTSSDSSAEPTGPVGLPHSGTSRYSSSSSPPPSQGVSVLSVSTTRPPLAALPPTRPPLYPQITPHVMPSGRRSAGGLSAGSTGASIPLVSRVSRLRGLGPRSADAPARTVSASPPTTLVIPHGQQSTTTSTARLARSQRTSGSGSEADANSVDGTGWCTPGLPSRQASECSLELFSAPSHGSSSARRTGSARGAITSGTNTTWALRQSLTLSLSRPQGPSSSASSRLSTPCATASLMSTFGGNGGGTGGASTMMQLVGPMSHYTTHSPFLATGIGPSAAPSSVSFGHSHPSITVNVGAGVSASSAETSFVSSCKAGVPSVELAAFVHELHQAKEEVVGHDTANVTFDGLCDILERASVSAMDVQLLAALFDDLLRPVLEMAVAHELSEASAPLLPTITAQAIAANMASCSSLTSITMRSTAPSMTHTAIMHGGDAVSADTTAITERDWRGRDVISSLILDDMRLSAVSSCASEADALEVHAEDADDDGEEPTVAFDAYVARITYLIAGQYPTEVLHRAFRHVALMSGSAHAEEAESGHMHAATTTDTVASCASSVPATRRVIARSSGGGLSTSASPLLPLGLREAGHRGFLPSLPSPSSSTQSLFVLHRATSLPSSPFNAVLGETYPSSASVVPDLMGTITSTGTASARAVTVPLALCVVDGLQACLGIRGLTVPLLAQALVGLALAPPHRHSSGASSASSAAAAAAATTGAAATTAPTTPTTSSDGHAAEPDWSQVRLTLAEFTALANQLATVTESLWRAELASRQGTPRLASLTDSLTGTGRAAGAAGEDDTIDSEYAHLMGVGEAEAAAVTTASTRAVGSMRSLDRSGAADEAGAAAANTSWASLPESISSAKGTVTTVTVGPPGPNAAQRRQDTEGSADRCSSRR